MMRAVPASAGTLLLGFVLLGCDEKKADIPAPVRPVNYQVVVPLMAETFGPFAGIIEPRYEAKLGFQIAGRMISRDVNVGDTVRAGQRLATLDPKVSAFALNQAKAGVADSQGQLANAASTVGRKRVLVGQGWSPQSDLEAATAADNTALARLAQSEAQLQKAEDQLGYTEIKADFAGVVTDWSAEVAQVVSAGQSVVTVARPDIEEAVVDIPDDLIAQVHPDEAFTVTLKAVPGVTAPGRVREIAPQSDAATRTRRVRMTLESPLPAFRLGTTVTVGIDRPTSSRITLPASAVRNRDGHNAVWIIRESGNGSSAHGTVLSRDVTLNRATADEVTVANGLDRDDKVVTAGVHSLVEGQAVRLGQRL